MSNLAQAMFRNDELHAYITGFGEGVNDLRCRISDMRLHGHADTATHYFSKSIGILIGVHAENYRAGPVYIPDVQKVGAFLKSCKEELTQLRHLSNVLTLKNGNDEFSMPTSEYVTSYQTVERAKVAIFTAREKSWSVLGRAKLQCHGTLNTEDIRGLESLTKVVGKSAPVRINVTDGEMTITAGQSRGAKMSRQIDIDLAANWEPCLTVFGPHLPKLMNLMPSGEILFHMGDKGALVMEHTEVDALLILKHQEGVEA